MADTSLLYTGMVLAGVGLVTGGIALKVQWDHKRWCAKRPRLKGMVSRIAERRAQGLSEDAAGFSTGTHYRAVPVVRFQAPNGVEYEIDADEAPNEIGAEVEVAYDPAQPSGARAVQRVPKIGLCIPLIVVGGALAAYAAAQPG